MKRWAMGEMVSWQGLRTEAHQPYLRLTSQLIAGRVHGAGWVKLQVQGYTGWHCSFRQVYDPAWVGARRLHCILPANRFLPQQATKCRSTTLGAAMDACSSWSALEMHFPHIWQVSLDLKAVYGGALSRHTTHCGHSHKSTGTIS